MIIITKKEAKYMRENGFSNCISIGSKTHKRKKYYLAENPKALVILEEYRQKIILD